jgi:urease accessory protein
LHIGLLEHFQEKWKPVFRRKCDQLKKLERVSDFSKSKHALAASLIALPVFLPAQPAFAHAPFEGAVGFYGGLLHPLFVPAHVLALTATGMLIGQQPRRLWLPPALFVGTLLIGCAAIVSAFAPDHINEALLTAAAVGGTLAAIGRPLPQFLICLQAAATGLAVALASPPEVTSLREALVMLIGTVCGATVILLAVAEGTSMLRRGWQRIGVRIVGSWIAASAALALTHALAR